MTEPVDLAREVLIRVAEFIRKLPADEVAGLASGEARLAVVPKGVRTAAPRAARAAVDTLPRAAGEIVTTMRDIGDRAVARRYLEVDLKLTEAKLRRLAADLGITVRTGKQKALDDLVEWAVGRRIDSDAISRAGAAR